MMDINEIREYLPHRYPFLLLDYAGPAEFSPTTERRGVGQDDEDVRKAAPEQFLEELEDPRWGQFSLNTSRWLMERSWTVDRGTTRGNRQGAAQLQSWLPRLLSRWMTRKIAASVNKSYCPR